MKLSSMARALTLGASLLPAIAVSKTADNVAELPAVTAMISTQTDTMQDIASQADALHTRVVQMQTENEAELAKQRAIYEHELRKLERNNHAINATNAKIRTEIQGLESGNSALKQHAEELRNSNAHVVAEIKALEKRVAVSQSFLHASLPTAEVRPTETVVGHHVAEENSDDSEDDADDNENDATSFLAWSMVRRAKDPQTKPEDLLTSLSSRVKAFAVQSQDSQAMLQKAYNSAHAEGEKHKLALLAEQTNLNKTRSSLQELQKHLRATDDDLENTKKQYQNRLRGFGLFLQRIAHVALAPEDMVTRFMQDLPDKVETTPATAK